MPTIHALASQLNAAFETAARPDGSEFVRLKDGSPGWMTDVVFAAHDGGAILPDDRLYRLTRDAAAHICDAGEYADLDDEEHSFADGAVDIWNSALAQWLADAPGHASACVDEWREELGGDDPDIFKQLQGGQYVEARNVFAAVVAALREIADEDDDGDGEDDNAEA